MGFDAGKAVIALDYDFSTVKVADESAAEILKEAKGTIPEPSQDALEAFQERLRSRIVDGGLEEIAALGDDPSTADVVSAISGLPEGALGEMMNDTLDAVADLCAGSPTREQINVLPARIRLAFIGWLTESLVGPTQPTPATTPSLATANGAGPTI